MNTLQTLHWASTEVIYFGSYAFVIGASLLTVLFARRAARMEDLKQARIDMEPDRLVSVKQPSLYPCKPHVSSHANDKGAPTEIFASHLPKDTAA